MNHTKRALRAALKAVMNDFEEDLDVSILNEHSVKSQIKSLVDTVIEVLEDQGYEEDKEDDLLDSIENLDLSDLADNYDDDGNDYFGFDLLGHDEEI